MTEDDILVYHSQCKKYAPCRLHRIYVQYIDSWDKYSCDYKVILGKNSLCVNQAPISKKNK